MTNDTLECRVWVKIPLNLPPTLCTTLGSLNPNISSNLVSQNRPKRSNKDQPNKPDTFQADLLLSIVEVRANPNVSSGHQVAKTSLDGNVPCRHGIRIEDSWTGLRHISSYWSLPCLPRWSWRVQLRSLVYWNIWPDAYRGQSSKWIDRRPVSPLGLDVSHLSSPHSMAFAVGTSLVSTSSSSK